MSCVPRQSAPDGSGRSGAGGWQEDLTAARLGSATRFGHLGRALSLLATLCSAAEAVPALGQTLAVGGAASMHAWPDRP